MSDTNLNDANFTPTIPDSEENTNQQTYSATGSFRFWCQKVLPLVYDDSLSYYELLCKVINYLNNVIQNVDNLNTSVTNTNTAFDNLQDYVNDTKDALILVYSELEQYANDYFNNLDVQEEINSKLDSMAEDGSLSTIISPFIPSIVSDWLSNNITPTSPAIDASLSVSGAGADAKVTGDQIHNLKSALTNNFSIGINLIPTETDGKFVDASNNNVSTSDSFALLGPVPVKRGQRIVFNARGYNTVVGMICTCNADNTERQTVVRSIDGTKREYTYDVLSDGFIVLSYVKSDGYELNATIDYYNYINTLNQLEPVFAGSQNVHIVPLLNGFIDPTTNRYNTSNSFKTSDSIRLFKGQTINFTATGYLTNVGMINLYDTNNDTYQSVARSIDSDEQLYRYTAVADCIVRLCYLASTMPTAVIITPQTDFVRVVNIETNVAKLQTPVAYPQLFDNILCIGDSLTVGASGNGNEILTKNYPHFLKKLTDADTTIKGHGGYSAKQVWDEYISTANDLSNYDCAIIYLGTNGGLTDTVETDCNASDYTQNADTNTGCYGKIIGKIKADAPNCKIFCVAGANENIRRANTMNPAVRSLSTLYAVGLVDIEESILSDDGSVGSQKRYTYRPVDAIHYNALGYLTLANLIGDGIHNYVSENLIKFA